MVAAQRRGRAGFTLIELVVVMAVVATLLSLVAPHYFTQIQRAKETALKADLRILRDAIDKHFADTGRYPESLDVLVTSRYVRTIPADPVHEGANEEGNDQSAWTLIEHPNQMPGVYDVRSASAGRGLDGTAYSSW